MYHSLLMMLSRVHMARKSGDSSVIPLYSPVAMMCKRALRGGTAISAPPSLRYISATRLFVAIIVFTDSAYEVSSCSSGCSISGSKTRWGFWNTLPKKAATNLELMRYPSTEAAIFSPLTTISGILSRKPLLMSQSAERSSSRMRDHTSGTSSEMSWSTCFLGPMTPAEEMKTDVSIMAYDTTAAFKSCTWLSMLKGPFVSAPSEPAPVVEGDLPVIDEVISMKSSGSS
mmetsp:Transcript_36754/g.53914  ORF Transcript_36754/g.53914 Transcript_36754/m.53914 type:complete len:229 (+) Transcript_36754:441-1127(+)